MGLVPEKPYQGLGMAIRQNYRESGNMWGFKKEV
jgi:hypothetical protein